MGGTNGKDRPQPDRAFKRNRQCREQKKTNKTLTINILKEIR